MNDYRRIPKLSLYSSSEPGGFIKRKVKGEDDGKTMEKKEVEMLVSGNERYHSTGLPPSGKSLLSQRFVEEHIKHCIRRIYPMESTMPIPIPFGSSFVAERVPTPTITSTSNVRINRQAEVTNFVNAILERSPSLYGFSSSFLSSSSSSARLTSTTRLEDFGSSIYFPSNRITMSNTSSPSRKNQGGSRSSSDFATALKKYSVPIPPNLTRKIGRTDSPGKVKVMLRICDISDEAGGTGMPGILGVDQRRKQVTLIDPGGGVVGSTSNSPGNNLASKENRIGISAPRLFGFDGIFGEDHDQSEICCAAVSELVSSVVSGEDGCFVSLNEGKKQTMIGKPANQKFGVIPTAISWLYKSIHEQKQKTGSRFSVRVSAIEITGGGPGNEVINDLLYPFVNDGDQPPGAYLDSQYHGGPKNSVTSSILNSVNEIRAPNQETAGFLLDAALNEMKNHDDPIRHFFYTLHVYQYTVDRNGQGVKGVAGGRSRLHCVQLGNGFPSISTLGGLLLAVLNGQRHLPSRDSKLGLILRECLGSLISRAVIMIHVSNVHSKYAETLAALQLGSRVHRLRRSRNRLKMGSVGGSGSGGSSGGSGEEMRNCSVSVGVGLGGSIVEGGETTSDIDPSSSEQSCDTVIYLGPSIDEATDGEHPPVFSLLESTAGENGGGGCSTTKISPKTKSPKPKSSSNGSSKLSSEGSFPNGKAEEKWVDGPKMTKYRTHRNSSGGSPCKKNENWVETWIDVPQGPGVSRVHQGNNFPSPKKTLGGKVRNGENLQNPAISSAKAQMIQKWISAQSQQHSLLRDPKHFSSSSSSLGPNSSSSSTSLQKTPFFSSNAPAASTFSSQQQQQLLYNNHKYQYNHQHYQQQPYINGFQEETLNGKPLTIFKTCEDDENERDEENRIQLKYEPMTPSDHDPNEEHNEFEFEFIEVVEPDIEPDTRDACFQVTEEDIALSFMEENPLPESDQNYSMMIGSFTTTGNSTKDKMWRRERSNSFCSEGHSPSEKDDKDESHPLRILSQECLTVVSTFTDSMSVAGDIERFWPKINLTNEITMQDIHEYGLCKDLLSSYSNQNSANKTQIRNNNAKKCFNPPPSALLNLRNRGKTEENQKNGNNNNNENDLLALRSPLEVQYKTDQIKRATSREIFPILTNGLNGHSNNISNSSSTALKVQDLPILSDESIYKVPANTFITNKKFNKLPSLKRETGSESEQESIAIPPMKLLDIAASKRMNGTSNSNGIQAAADQNKITSPNNIIGESKMLSPIQSRDGTLRSFKGCDHNHQNLFKNEVVDSLNKVVVVNKSNGNGVLDNIEKIVSPSSISDFLPNPADANDEIIEIADIQNSSNTNGKVKTLSNGNNITTNGKKSKANEIPDSPNLTKSPSKSKSRKIARFFKSRSKSPKTVSGSSESGKSSSDSKSNASAASSSSSEISKGKVFKILSPKHQSPKKVKNGKAISVVNNNSDYHFACDSVLPLFLPSPMHNIKNNCKNEHSLVTTITIENNSQS